MQTNASRITDKILVVDDQQDEDLGVIQDIHMY